MIGAGWCRSFDKTPLVGYTYRLLMGAAGTFRRHPKSPRSED